MSVADQGNQILMPYEIALWYKGVSVRPPGQAQTFAHAVAEAQQIVSRFSIERDELLFVTVAETTVQRGAGMQRRLVWDSGSQGNYPSEFWVIPVEVTATLPAPLENAQKGALTLNVGHWALVAGVSQQNDTAKEIAWLGQNVHAVFHIQVRYVLVFEQMEHVLRKTVLNLLNQHASVQLDMNGNRVALHADYVLRTELKVLHTSMVARAA